MRAFTGVLSRLSAVAAGGTVVMSEVPVMQGVWLVGLKQVAGLCLEQVASWSIAGIAVVPGIRALVVCARMFVALVKLIVPVVIVTAAKVCGGKTSWVVAILLSFAVLVRLQLALIKQTA